MFDADTCPTVSPDVVTPRFDPKEERKARVLVWVNELRAKLFGLAPLTELPRGNMGSSRSCVIARALDSRVSVKTDRIFKWPSYELCDYPYPVFVRKFVNDFDLGHYPELSDENHDLFNP